jgi:hypothetical protein
MRRRRLFKKICRFWPFTVKGITNKNNKNITVKIYVGVNEKKNVKETVILCRLCDIPRPTVQLDSPTEKRPKPCCVTSCYFRQGVFSCWIRDGRGSSQMETFANIIVKGQNRWNNLFPSVALCPKLGAFVRFFCGGRFGAPCGSDISIYPFSQRNTDLKKF